MTMSCRSGCLISLGKLTSQPGAFPKQTVRNLSLLTSLSAEKESKRLTDFPATD